MKNKFAIVFSLIVLAACEPGDVQKTKDAISSAEELMNKTTDGMKTLDSISKIIGDTAQVNSQIKNIQKQIDEHRNNGTLDHFDVDSMVKVAKKSVPELTKKAETIKAIDSAATALKNTDNPVEIVSSVAKILDQLGNDKTVSNPKNETKSEVKKEVAPPSSERIEIRDNATQLVSDPLIQTAKMDFGVQNLTTTNQKLNDVLSQYNVVISSDKTITEEGQHKKELVLEMPNNQFSRFIGDLESEFGSPKFKLIESTGSDRISEQKSTVQLSFTENASLVNTAFETENPSEGTKDEGVGAAFAKGWDGLSKVGLWLIPFWPLFLIGGLLWFFISKFSKKKESKLPQQEYHRTENMDSSETNNIVEDAQPKNDDTDYSKFMPK